MSKFERLYDRFDAQKWAHPELAERYEALMAAGTATIDSIYNYDIPFEERKAAVAVQAAGMRELLGTGKETGNPAIDRREIHVAPGCPEEPETEVEVVIYRPAEPKSDKLNVLFAAAGGGMVMCMIEFYIYWMLADRYDCAVVCPRYRTAMEGHTYPAAINDLHAGYEWMIANADELGIDPDMVVLYGASSGSNLALSLAHRLKRYGHRPRGCVVECAFTDNRPIFKTSTILGPWDGRAMWLSSMQYLGLNNVSCFNNPEMFPNYATPEDCVGLCPTFMHPDAEEANSATCRAYQDTLSQAGVYNELHCWGGSAHGVISNATLLDPDSEYVQRYQSVLDGNIRDCWKYDLRRLWIEEALAD